MMDPMIAVHDVHRRLGGTQALAGVSLHVDAGEVVGLLGPNGAGKSTLVSCIAGLRRPDRGTVRVAGADPAVDRARTLATLGVQLQRAVYNDALTVREVLAMLTPFHASPWPVDELLQAVDLTERAGTRVGDLSGGQHQRLSLATALLGRPSVVVLDELSTGLDPRARRRMWRLVERLRDEGVSVLLVSHAMDEVERLCDRVVVLESGSVAAHGTVQEVVAHAADGGDVDVVSFADAYLAITGEHAEDELEEEAR